MKALALNTVGIVIITALVIIVGVMLVTSFSAGKDKSIVDKVSEGIGNLPGIFVGKVVAPKVDICETFENQRLSYEDFLSLLTALKNNNCDEMKTAKLQFSASFSDIEAMASQSGIKSVLYTDSLKPLGAGVLIIKGDAGLYPLKFDDQINVTAAGSPEKDILVQVTVKGCDPYDEVCDASCSFVKGVCDPKCYAHDQKTEEFCDMDCVDINRDGMIAANDSDGVCDLDCYNDVMDMERAYDVDCIWERGSQIDDICDPDTNGVADSYCDADCEKQNNICDPDCSNDPDCKCDNMCNGFCSAGCRNEPDYPDNDPDCQIKEGKISWCEGDGKCDRLGGENCENSDDDCPGGGLTCLSLPGEPVCCDSGCTLTKGLDEGSPCSCTNQCDKGQKLVCNNGAKGEGKFCCPDGMAWNGTKCIELEQLNFAIVAIGFSESQQDAFLAEAKNSYEYFVRDRSPFKECADPLSRVKPYYLGPKECGSGGCSDHCSNCISAGAACIRKNGLDGKIDKFAVITTGSFLGGCASGIPARGSSSRFIPNGVSWKPTNEVLYTKEVVAHETGHVSGLYHVAGCGAGGACLGPNAADCSFPPQERYKFMMDYCMPFERFGPAGYNYMKTNTYAKWLKGCG
ncbi:MAG: hypothetical protein HYX24_00525 [Candidatus Aenigmarchaeota archaeon]|nr:hypothetical protein [Candidatus Aenigmarchaeota archaeon]